MYYSYIEIEYVATSVSPARMDFALKLLSLDFPVLVEAILYDKDERPELFAYFVQGGCG
jgi:hypothetical protein